MYIVKCFIKNFCINVKGCNSWQLFENVFTIFIFIILIFKKLNLLQNEFFKLKQLNFLKQKKIKNI